MCNLGEGLVERTNEKVIINMYKKGYTYDEIADVIELSVNDIKVIIENKKIL